MCKKYSRVSPQNLQQNIDMHHWEPGQVRHFEFRFPQMTKSVLVACTQQYSYEIDINWDAVEQVMAKIPEEIEKYTDITSITSAMWWTGIIHGQSAAVYQSTLKRLLKWGGKIEIFTKLLNRVIFVPFEFGMRIVNILKRHFCFSLRVFDLPSSLGVGPPLL